MSNNYTGSNIEKKLWTYANPIQRNEAKEIKSDNFTQSWKSDNYMESNSEKSNIAIAILEK